MTEKYLVLCLAQPSDTSKKPQKPLSKEGRPRSLMEHCLS